MRVRSAAAVVAALVLPGVIAVAWFGCATADEEVDANPKKMPDAAAYDTGGGGGDSLGGDAPIFPTEDAGPYCGETSTPNSCASATDLGSIAVGSTKKVTGGLPLAGGDVWYTVKFTGLDDLKAHPRIKISGDKGLFLAMEGKCSGGALKCGGDGGTATSVKDLEVSYVMTADPDGGVPDPDSSAEEAGTNFKPITIGESGTVKFRVFRTGTATGCDFTIDLSN
ncbi:MAG: hypothetical protein HYV09_22020 [Deltaproteobacteria bacterium]|nr:hypothetical protein [Deltaproteobacteria bacterium]